MLVKLPSKAVNFPYTREPIAAITAANSIVVKTAKLFEAVVLLPLRLVLDLVYQVVRATNRLIRRDVELKNSVMDRFFAIANSLKYRAIDVAKVSKDFAKENQTTIIKTALIGLSVTALGYFTYPKISELLGSNIIDDTVDNTTSSMPLKPNPISGLINAIKNSPTSADIAICTPTSLADAIKRASPDVLGEISKVANSPPNASGLADDFIQSLYIAIPVAIVFVLCRACCGRAYQVNSKIVSRIEPSASREVAPIEPDEEEVNSKIGSQIEPSASREVAPIEPDEEEVNSKIGSQIEPSASREVAATEPD